jgi:voltage-gated potassium channel
MDASDVAKFPLFAELDETEAARLAELFREAKALPGRRPAIQGDFGYRFFVVLEGTAVVRVDGKEVGELGPGDFFGEMALLDDAGRRTAEVDVTSKMRYASLMTWEFRKLLDDHPEISAKVQAAIEDHRARDKETRGSDSG